MSRETITTNFPSQEDFTKEMGKFGKETTSIYARYEYPELAEDEKKLAKMMGVSDTALFTAGMAAIHTAIEAEELTAGDVVLCGKDVYGLTKDLYADLKKRGVEIEMIDSGNMTEIEERVKAKKPRLIILESVGNAQGMPVCDIKKLGEIATEANQNYAENYSEEKVLDMRIGRLGEVSTEIKTEILQAIVEFRKGNNQFVFRDVLNKLARPIVAQNLFGTSDPTEKQIKMANREAIHSILPEFARLIRFVLKNSREKLSLIIDNTLASPINYNPAKDLEGSGAKGIIVESATKAYQKGQDKITMGIVYSNDSEAVRAVKMKRMSRGTILQPNDEKLIPRDVDKAMPEIMPQHAQNALALAELISRSGKAIEVSHPNLPEHKNNELVQKISPDGITVVFYMKIKNAPAFVQKVKDLGGARIGIGGSFDHPETYLFCADDQHVRVAAGSGTSSEFEKTLDVFAQALEEYDKL